MATGLISWSKTAASNATADSNVNFSEGQAPSSVNDSARALMASAAMYRDDVSGALTTGGTTTAYTLTSSQVFASLTAMSGAKLVVRFNATNGTAPTLNVDGLGAKNIQTASGTAVINGALLANSVHQLTYDNSIPAWLLHGVHGALASDTVATGSIQNSAVSTVKIADDAVTDAKIRESAALSVIGRSANSTGNPADIAAGTDGHVLRRSGTTLGFGALAAGAFADNTIAKARLQSDVFASQAEMETGTATDVAVTPGRTKNHPGVAKAWVTFAGSNGAIQASYNIQAVNRLAAGQYSIEFTTNMSGAEYPISINVLDGGVVRPRVASQTASSFVVHTEGSDVTRVLVIVMGDQ